MYYVRLGLPLGVILMLTGCTIEFVEEVPGEISRTVRQPVEGRSGYEIITREAQELPPPEVREAEVPQADTTYEITAPLDTSLTSATLEPDGRQVSQTVNTAAGNTVQSMPLRRQRQLLRRYRNLAVYKFQKQRE